MRIQVLCIGDNPEKWVTQALEQYLVRLRIWKVEQQVIPSIKMQNKEQVKKMETNILLKNAKYSKIIFLDKLGMQLSSEKFAHHISNISAVYGGGITFIIGGAWGFAQDLILDYEKISFSHMTFAHAIARIILLEQIYRSYCILNNHPYNK